MKNNKALFDQETTPLVYGSLGINLDFVKHKTAEADPDLVAGYICDILAKDAPVIGLEKSLTITGAAQNLTFQGPRISDVNLAVPPALIGVELALQLNNLAIPNSDFKFIVRLKNVFGDELVAMTQEVTGTASVMEGSTRQYLRLMCFQRFGSYSDQGAVTFNDGRSVNFPSFVSVSPAELAAFQAIIPDAVAKTMFADLAKNIATIDVEIPAASLTAGVVVTITPIISGRQDTLEAIISTLDNAGVANAAPADKSNVATKMLNF
jgi:hypothetical protein